MEPSFRERGRVNQNGEGVGKFASSRPKKREEMASSGIERDEGHVIRESEVKVKTEIIFFITHSTTQPTLFVNYIENPLDLGFSVLCFVFC